MKASLTSTIGITTYGTNKANSFHLPREYVDAVRLAGGVPVLLTPGEQNIEAVLQVVDGLIFAGGGDIDPSFYDGKSHPTTSGVSRERDEFELKLARSALSEHKPILGICRGFQLLGVATGADLVPHVPEAFGSTVEHRTEKSGFADHVVEIEQGSRLATIMGSTHISVRSKHHQALNKIPDGWTVAARSADSVVEALDYMNHPWLITVLWHPEESVDNDGHMALFKALVGEAESNRSQ
ncbi:gamma-glutamyl-gamma-aminobutyrate hydrolase family protein [bacterium]|nr:gamma-glutamyl-gamma-aminobutyrate hydrolase family protein [bacterium]